ncbi:Putative ABC-2 type transporter [Candidatus Sulfobium mesophilum]|uniref:ABC-2 type transporter n=1 Tax=Candidatus Sulfobium mesophilum TaxID=2016548 RepID=A0A2U3QH52_9BACT|nr:Putative ABC-2 type transporter [Candidatus Sulfobium mesophilum]
MRLHRLTAIARKEVLQIMRDARSIAIVVGMPVIMMLAFGYGISFDVKHLPVYVFDREGSQKSQDLLKHFQASEYFEVVQTVNNYPALVRAVDAGDCKLALVVPHDFSHKLNSGRPVTVQALIDGTDSNSANIAIAYSQAVVQNYSRQIQFDWIRRHGQSAILAPLSIDARTWFNENLESLANIVPGVIVIVMAVVGTFLTALTISREWERGTMEQLISTPVTALELMIGKLAPYFVIGLVDTCLCTALGILWFGVPFRGSWIWFFISSTLFLIVILSVGYFISVTAKSQLAASQISLFATFLPTFLLSGFLFPIDQMPVAIQAVTYLFPARYYMTIVRNVFLKGAAITLLLNELIAMSIMAFLLVFIATRIFKKKLS